jgi:large subunit ribosomal protein L2
VGRHPLLAEYLREDGTKFYNVAPEGISVGDRIEVGPTPTQGMIAIGSILPLSAIPDGTSIFNIEIRFGDGGKMCRSGGAVAYVVSHDEEKNTVTVLLSSKQTRVLSGRARATVGVACGGGRLEKPLMKAGTAFHKARATNKQWPWVRGTAMAAYDHPHGGKSLGKSNTVARSTPPGRKTGSVAASRTGRRRGKRELSDSAAQNQK